MRAGRRGKTGFTLVELMVAFLILTVVLGAVYGSLRVGIAAWRASEMKADQNQAARAVLAQISRELRSAFVPPAGSSSSFDFVGVPAEGEGAHGGYADRISFVCVAPASLATDAEMQLRRVAYYLAEPEDRSPDEGMVLYRYMEPALEPVLDLEQFVDGLIEPLEDVDRKMPKPEPLIDGVLELQLSYYDGIEWMDRWVSEIEPPRAVIVSLVMPPTSRGDGDVVTFTTAVEIPTVHDVGGTRGLSNRYDVATVAEDAEKGAVTIQLDEAPERAEPGTMTIKSGGRTVAQVEFTEVRGGVATLRSPLPRSLKKGDQAWILRPGSETLAARGRYLAGGQRQASPGSVTTPNVPATAGTETPTVVGPDGRPIQLPPPPPDEYY